MKSTPQRDRFEVHDDLEFQRKTWRFERIGWGVMALLVLAALLGLAGPGWLSKTTATNAPLRVNYERFLRRDAPVTVEVHVDADAVSDGAIDLLLDAGFDDFRIERVVPVPTEWRLTSTGMALRFAVAGDDDALGVIRLHVEPQRAGRGVARIGIADRPPVQLRYFIYP